MDNVAGAKADWENQRKDRSSPARGGGPSRSDGGGAQAEPRSPPPPRKGKLTFKDQRDYDLLPTRVEELSAQIARDEAALHDPALYTRDPAKFAALSDAIAKARTEKDAAEERWLELAELVEG